MPSRAVYEKLLKAGLGLNAGDGKRYSMYDSLESSEDLESLFLSLNRYKDSTGSPARFTAVSVVANPDFDRIKANGFQTYFYEPFSETAKRYDLGDTINLYHQGIQNKVFIPQFHGREHLNVPVWLKALQQDNTETHMAFNERMWAFVPRVNFWEGLEYEAAFQLSETVELEDHRKTIEEGLDLFEKSFGYKAEYFVPPNGHINNSLNGVCFNKGVKLRSTAKIQLEPIGNGTVKKRVHWLGQRDKSGLRYVTRNCFFEPCSGGKDWVDSCLNDVRLSFRWNKPAIISSHRVNYIGVHDKTNREKSLQELEKLLSGIVKNWPDVEFISTDQLVALLDGNKQE
jgi:hypothetical protein